MVRTKDKLYTILKKYINGNILGNSSIILKKNTMLKRLTGNHLTILDNVCLVFLVNNVPKWKEYILYEGDEVKIFSVLCDR